MIQSRRRTQERISDWLKQWTVQFVGVKAKKVKGQCFSKNRQKFSYLLKISLLWLCFVCEFVLFEAKSSRRHSMAWLEPNGAKRPMRGDVLVVVIGVLCWHPGSTACWRDNRPVGGRAGERESEHPPFNTMWPGLYPGCGQLKSEPVMHICALFDPRFNLVLVCAEGNKQSTVPPCSHIPEWTPTQPPCVETHLDTCITENAKVQILYWSSIPA